MLAACSLSEEVIDLLSVSLATIISAPFEAAPVEAVVAMVVVVPEGIFLCSSLAVVFPSAVCLDCLAGEEVVVLVSFLLVCRAGSRSVAVVFSSVVGLAGEEVVVVTGSLLLCLAGSHSVALVFSSATCLVCLAGKEVAVLLGLMFICLACSCSVAVVLVCWFSLHAVVVS